MIIPIYLCLRILEINFIDSCLYFLSAMIVTIYGYSPFLQYKQTKGNTHKWIQWLVYYPNFGCKGRIIYYLRADSAIIW